MAPINGFQATANTVASDPTNTRVSPSCIRLLSISQAMTVAALTTANTVASDPTTGTTVETISRGSAITTIVETEIAQAATTVEALAIKVVAPTTATDHPATTATDHPVTIYLAIATLKEEEIKDLITILIVEILLTIQTQPIQLAIASLKEEEIKDLITILIVVILLTIQTQPIQLLSSKTEELLIFLQSTQMKALEPTKIL